MQFTKKEKKKILDINARRLGEEDSQDMGKIIKEMGRSMDRVELMVKADSCRWHDRWYCLLKKATGDEGNQEAGLLPMREKFIPRPRERPESGITGLDSFNLEPMTGNAGQTGNTNVNVNRKYGQDKTPWHGRGGTGINPDRDVRLHNHQSHSMHHEDGYRERSKSRSQERPRREDNGRADLSDLRKLMASRGEEGESEMPMDASEGKGVKWTRYSTGPRDEREHK